MSARRQARRLARERRRYEASLLRVLVPQPLTAEQRWLLLSHAHRVRLRDGTLLSAALGRLPPGPARAPVVGQHGPGAGAKAGGLAAAGHPPAFARVRTIRSPRGRALAATRGRGNTG